VVFGACTTETSKDPRLMTPTERNAAMVGAGVAGFVLGVLYFLLGEWGLWPTIIVMLIGAGMALADDPDKK